MLINIGFFLMVSSMLTFHTYLASKNLTTCIIHNNVNNFRGISLMDEDILYESMAKEVRFSFQ